MQIKNIEGLTPQQIRTYVNGGGTFVMYKYCISIIVMTFNNPTDVYFIKPGESKVVPGLGFLFVSLFLGWWGIPWGPIYTIGNIFSILTGGKDVTQVIMSEINQNDPSYGTGNSYAIPGHERAESGSAYNIPGHETVEAGNTYNIPGQTSDTYNIR